MLLKRIGKFRARGEISSIAHTRRLIAVASFDDCIYFIREDGSLHSKYCSDSEVLDLDASTKVVGVTKSGKALIFEEGDLVNEFYLGESASMVVIALEDSFIACYKECLKLSYDGKVLWRRRRFGTITRGARDDLIYLYDKGGRIIGIDKSGDVKFENKIYVDSIAACSRYLSIAKGKSVVLLEGGRHLKNFEGLEWVTHVKFSDDCKKLAVVEGERGIIHICDLEGHEKAVTTFNGWLTALDWAGDVLIAGYNDGLVEIFQVAEGSEVSIRYHIIPKGYLVEMRRHDLPLIYIPRGSTRSSESQNTWRRREWY